MINTILLIIAASTFGLYQEINKPAEYELNMADGSTSGVVLQKNNNYSCPVYCEINHTHIAVTCDKNCNKKHKNYHLHDLTEIDKGTATFCSKQIIAMNKITAKDKLPDVVSASK